MGRAPCCDKASVKKGPWSPEEDAKLKDFIEKFGTGGNWIALPQKAGLKRCGKSCRLRWLNYLRPNIRHGEFSDDEDRIICSLYASIGSRWSVIAAQLPGRTDNDIKNYWNTKLKKKIMAILPSLQEKPSFFPSLPFQPPTVLPLSLPPYDHHNYHKSDQFQSSFHSYNTPNFMTVDTNSNYLIDHINVTDLSSPPPQSVNHLMNKNNDINDNCYGYLGSQDDHHSMCNSPMHEYYSSSSPSVNEGMFMFGGESSSNKDHHQKQQSQIKQEQQVILDQDFADQSQGFMINDHNCINQKPNEYMIKNHVSPLCNDLQVVNQPNINSYLFNINDGDENMTTHYQKGICYYY